VFDFLIARILAAGFVLALLAGCADSRGGPIPYGQTLAAPDAPVLATLESDYKIAPMDKIGVKVFKSEDLSGEYEVDLAGHISLPLIGEIWTKYQVAQFSRVLGTLLLGGIPLVQALETAGESMGARIMRTALDRARKLVREGQPLSASLKTTGIFPPLATDMIEVGESTGALPAMLTSVSEFFEDDVNTRLTAAMALIEPAIMLFMGGFVAFVLVALYLPIFSLAEKV